ncbi:MAG: polymer-forming cytoskeletal protein [Candidatus Omnitrophica bacterium]|nr:polymer-forming cytoskeletal protein [Candidatus Omnitrophota bacterium]
MPLRRKALEEKVLDVDASMQGALIFKDSVNLRINGKFEGTLETRGSLTLGQTSYVNAAITGDEIVVAGRVNGKITARVKLTLLSSAIVQGEIMPSKLVINDGALFEGTCRMLQDYFNAEELARYLEVDINSVMEWADSGKVPGNKESEGWKFERKAVDEWIASGRI